MKIDSTAEQYNNLIKYMLRVISSTLRNHSLVARKWGCAVGFGFGGKKKKAKELVDRPMQYPSKEGVYDNIPDEEELEEGQAQMEADLSNKIDPKYHVRSASLYDKYMERRERPLTCLDDYLLAYEFIIQRKPIFVPFHQKSFEAHRNRYLMAKKTGYYGDIPKDLKVQDGDYPFDQYDLLNQENQTSHEIKINENQKVEYREHSRLWRFTDPNIIDPHSIQTYSSNNVFFIVKNTNGKWTFPIKYLNQKDTHKDIFSQMTQDLFPKFQNPDIYYFHRAPVGIRKVDRTDLPKGKGYRYLTFMGESIKGIGGGLKIFQDYAWVPKPLLSQYFDDDYFSQTIRMTPHIF